MNKKNKTKSYIIIIIILIALAVFFGYKKIQQPTDVFAGSVLEKITTDSSIPGQRFKIEVADNSNFPHKGNAHGDVIVNDTSGSLDLHNRGGGIGYIFYTQYDAENNWYIIIKTTGLSRVDPLY